MKMNAVRFMRSKKPRQPEEMEKKVSERHDEVDLPRDSAGLMDTPMSHRNISTQKVVESSKSMLYNSN